MNDNVVAMNQGFVGNVRELRVYRRAFELSLEVHKASLEFPKIEQYALADQLRRSSKSICANLAEGFSRQAQSGPEFNRFLSIAMGSANEALVWTEYALALGYIGQDQFDRWADGFDHVAKMLQNLKK